MKRAIAGIGTVVVARLFVLLLPVVPASALAAPPYRSHPRTFAVSGCLIHTSDAQGYGSISFRMFGVGGIRFEGHYGLATASNCSVSVVD